MKAKLIVSGVVAMCRSLWSRIGIRYSVLVVMLSCTTVAIASSTPARKFHGADKAHALTFVYECEQGNTFVATATDTSATIFVSGKTDQLPRVRSASGEKFQTEDTLFWMKGDEALLDTEDSAFRGCRNNRMLAIREDARLRGVNFRATGNEPGWYLEVSANDQILFVTDYGQSLYLFSEAEAPSDPHAQNNVLQATNDKHRLELIRLRKQCMDSMSDQQFDTSVTVRLDDREYHGCGSKILQTVR